MEVDLQLSDYKTDVKNNIFHSIAILEQAIKTLIEDIEDENQIIVDPDASVLKITVSQSRRVFVVHGHDEGARETVARFLERTGFEAVILHEQANEGRAIIEKFEAHGEVGFAVILLTPDDVGSTKGGNLKPRARQNVILELGYFFGRLGRNRVAALKRGDIELPSDFDGIVYTPFDNGSGWQVALAKELIAAGFEIDWNKVYN